MNNEMMINADSLFEVAESFDTTVGVIKRC
jgi:hypothetical protein